MINNPLNARLVVIWSLFLFLLPSIFLIPLIESSLGLGVRLGVVSYAWMLAAIYLSTKPHWVDRWVGLSHLYVIHGFLSLSAILLALFHKELYPSQGLIKSTGEAALIIFLAVAAFSMLFLSDWLTSRIKILDFIKKKLESYLKHEQSIWIHRLMLLATALIFIHVLLIPEVTQNKFFVSLFSFVSLIIISFLYLWAAFAPQAKGLEGHLKDCQKIGDHIVKLTISVPEQYQLNIQPGDFVFISFPEYPKMKEPHPFSVFNVPSMKQDIEFVIREVGDFTQQLASLDLGSRVSISQGFGQYQSIIKGTNLVNYS